VVNTNGRDWLLACLAAIDGTHRSYWMDWIARLVTEVAEAPGRLAFSHAIVRDAVQEALAPSARGPLHAAVVGRALLVPLSPPGPPAAQAGQSGP